MRNIRITGISQILDMYDKYLTYINFIMCSWVCHGDGVLKKVFLNK